MDTTVKFAALADPVRLQIVELLADQPRDAGSIAEEFPISRPAVSRHLRVLREATVVSSQVTGRNRIYSLHPDAFGEIERWLMRYRRFWTERLDALEHRLESTPRKDQADE